MKRQPTPGFLPGKSHKLLEESDITQLLNNNSKLDLGPTWIYKKDLISIFFTESYLQKNIFTNRAAFMGSGGCGRYFPFEGITIQPTIAQLVKNLPAMQETPVLFLGPEDPLEKG